MNKTEFTAEFLKEISQGNFVEYFQQFSVLSKKQFLISDLGLTARKFQQWKELGITPPTIKEKKKDEKREWTKLDYIENIWMKMIISLNNIGYSYTNINNAKEFLFKTIDLDSAMKRAEDEPKIIKQLTDFYAKDSIPDDLKELFADSIKSTEFIDKMSNQFSKRRSLLELLIFEAIQNKNMEIGVAFFENGRCLPFNWNLLVTFDAWSEDLTKEEVLNSTIRTPHIYISITKFIMDFLAEEGIQKQELALVMYNNEEITLLRELRNKDYKNITINYDKGTNTKIIKTEKEKRIKETEVQNVIKNILFAPNSKTTYTKTNNGDLIINTITTKKINNTAHHRK